MIFHRIASPPPTKDRHRHRARLKIRGPLSSLPCLSDISRGTERSPLFSRLAPLAFFLPLATECASVLGKRQQNTDSAPIAASPPVFEQIQSLTALQKPEIGPNWRANTFAGRCTARNMPAERCTLAVNYTLVGRCKFLRTLRSNSSGRWG